VADASAHAVGFQSRPRHGDFQMGEPGLDPRAGVGGDCRRRAVKRCVSKRRPSMMTSVRQEDVLRIEAGQCVPAPSAWMCAPLRRQLGPDDLTPTWRPDRVTTRRKQCEAERPGSLRDSVTLPGKQAVRNYDRASAAPSAPRRAAHILHAATVRDSPRTERNSRTMPAPRPAPAPAVL